MKRTLDFLKNIVRMKKVQKKKTLRESLHLYRTVAGWNGESATELLKSVRRLAEGSPGLLMRMAAMHLNRYRVPREMRFDYSELREPGLAVDKRGLALVGTLRAPKVMPLVKI
jgi:hypothetical protein